MLASCKTLATGLAFLLLTGCVGIPQNVAEPSPMSRVLRNLPPERAVNEPLDDASEFRPDRPMAPILPGQPLVLMAISGGGSRSAYYAAAVMEELSRLPVAGVIPVPLAEGVAASPAFCSLLDQ